MKKLEACDQDFLKGPQSSHPAVLVISLIKSGLYHLDIPVAEFVPHKVVDLLYCDAELEFIHIIRHSLNSIVEAGQNPLVLRADRGGHLVRVDERAQNGLIFGTFLRKVHHDKSGGVPDLICEVSVRDDSLVVETHIVSGRIAGDKSHSQRVRTVVPDDLQRINAVSEGLGHLAAQGIPDKSMEENALKRSLSHLLIAGEDHSDDPEEDDVVACDQHIRRIEVFEIFCHFRPSQCAERPQRAGEPCIQGIRILSEVCAAALRANDRRLFGDDCLTALVAVICGDPVAPPELAADAPVADVVGPVEIGLLHPLRDQTDFALFDRLDSRLDQLVHLHKPLLLDQGLNGSAASVMGPYVVSVVLNAD